MKIVEVGVNNRRVGKTAQVNTTACVVMSSTVDPVTIQNNMVSGASSSGEDHVADVARIGRPGNFQSHDSVMVGSSLKRDWAGSGSLANEQLCHYVGRGCA